VTKTFDIDDSRLHQTLVFGDQLTVACARGAARFKDDDTTALYHLEGFIPAVADWHARMCLLQIKFYFIKLMYKVYFR